MANDTAAIVTKLRSHGVKAHTPKLSKALQAGAYFRYDGFIFLSALWFMNNIIYPGTFDPVTLGHSNLIERAAFLFDHVIVAVADSKKKAPMFTLEERVALIEEATAHVPNVSVIAFSGLIVDVAQEQQCKAVLRGVRSVTDFDYELQMASMNSVMYKRFETVFLTPAVQYNFISSSLVKEIASMHGDVSGFVPATVLAALNAKFAND